MADLKVDESRHSREVRPASGRPASGRQEDQRDRYAREHGPPMAKMADLKVNKSRHSRGTETSSQNKGKGPTNADRIPEQGIDSQIGSPGGEIQQRRRYTITGTPGDTEWLDAGKLVSIC